VDIWTLISGVGLGAIGAKLLDIMWLQNKLREQKHEEWLRDSRLEAFTEVTKEFVSFGLHGKDRGPFDSYAAISKALLLIDDEELLKRLDNFVANLFEVNSLADQDKDEEGKRKFEALVREAREITRSLRMLMLHDKVRS
jgi:hypothetical protein